MSVLQPDTSRQLAHWSRTAPHNPVVRRQEESALFGELRAWLEGRPHTAECRCPGCRIAKATLRTCARCGDPLMPEEDAAACAACAA